MNSVLKSLRDEKGYTQEELAQKLEISRQTYIKYENLKGKPAIEVIEKLAKLFDVDCSCIIENKMPVKPTYNVICNCEEKTKEPEIRINIPIKNIEKFKQVFLYILKKIGAKPNVGQTVLYKLLYFIDFDYYELFEEQLMGLEYIKNKHGPTPVDFTKLTKQMEDDKEIVEVKAKYFDKDQTKYLPVKESNLSMLSAPELVHIDKVLEKHSDKSATELSNFSHKDIPWISSENMEVIEYEAVFYRNEETSVREYNEDGD